MLAETVVRSRCSRVLAAAHHFPVGQATSFWLPRAAMWALGQHPQALPSCTLLETSLPPVVNPLSLRQPLMAGGSSTRWRALRTGLRILAGHSSFTVGLLSNSIRSLPRP